MGPLLTGTAWAWALLSAELEREVGQGPLSLCRYHGHLSALQSLLGSFLLSLVTRQKLLPEPQVGRALWSTTHAQVWGLWKSPEELAPGPSVLLGLGA